MEERKTIQLDEGNYHRWVQQAEAVLMMKQLTGHVMEPFSEHNQLHKVRAQLAQTKAEVKKAMKRDKPKDEDPNAKPDAKPDGTDKKSRREKKDEKKAESHLFASSPEALKAQVKSLENELNKLEKDNARAYGHLFTLATAGSAFG